MKIKKIKIQNYRLLKDFSMDIEDDLSLVVGKNNCGKTSILSLADKFINSSKTAFKFAFDDFNIDFRNSLETLILSVDNQDIKPIGITLKIFIEYNEDDNLSNISGLIMDLDPESKTVVILFEYILSIEKASELKAEFSKVSAEDTDVKFETFLKDNYHRYFELFQKTIAFDRISQKEDDTDFMYIENTGVNIGNIIHCRHIKARRDVSNKLPDRWLSSLSSKIYKKLESNEEQATAVEEFKNALNSADKALNAVYDQLFTKVIEKVKQFWWIQANETVIKVTSTLQHQELLESNTTVMYEYDGYLLPESYNGLGYMNLISMIFEIEIAVNEFQEKSADINLLFIEEPEAHTHPQMQYIFIQNIKWLLKGVRSLQCIISTHSSHIVAESEFDDIKYLMRSGNSAIAKNLKDLKEEYVGRNENAEYKFLKQYLTLHRAELFFADKVIFIEWDTERILLPAMMKKIDQEVPKNPLLSQNISIIETGNYSHIFEKFIDFIGVKSLIITDIDSADNSNLACEVGSGSATLTTNASLSFFYGTNKLTDFKDKEVSEMLLKKQCIAWDSVKKWITDASWKVVCVYQISERNQSRDKYCGRSFEDAFFHLNRQFIIDNKDNFKSLQNKSQFEDQLNNPYILAQNCVKKKPAFAIEVLLNSKTDTNGVEFSNWQTPNYIKQWLLWLKD